MAVIGRPLGQQEGEWKAAIRELQEKVKQEESEVSGLKEVLGNFDGKHEKLRETIARQGDDLAEARRRSEELDGRVDQLEGENRLLRDSNEGLKGQLARVEAGQQSEVAHLQEAIEGGGSKAKKDLGNVQ
jgi:chromosome segregation ATPase